MKNNKPAYLKLYEQLRTAIIDGVFPYETRLPSKRTLASEFDLSLITVEHALALLEEEGYIEPKERSGSFVSYRREDVLPVNEEHFLNPVEYTAPKSSFPYSVISRTIRRVLSDYQEEILKKSPPCGLLMLQEAIASYLFTSRGISVSPRQIIIGSGAEYLYGLIVQTLGRNLTYGIENPSYQTIRRIYEANDVKIDLLKLGNNGILSGELKRTRADVLHITPFRSFPTGISADASKRREYIAWARKRKAMIIEDDYDSEFTLSGKPADTLLALSNGDCVIYLSTFSTTIAPSIRIGYMILPVHLLSAFEEKAGFYSCTVSTFSQLILYELISSGDYARNVNRMRRERRRNASSRQNRESCS